MYDPTAPEYQGMPKFIKIELNSLISYLGNLEITLGSCSKNMRLMYKPDQVRDVQLVTLDIPIYTQTESFASMKFPTISTEC